MNNKKGFTLIELLAVILILGIIALIAIPTVNKILTEAREGAFKTSANNIMKSAEQKCQTQLIRGEKPTLIYTFLNGKPSSNLEIKGTMPDDGYIFLSKECSVIDFYLKNQNTFYSSGEDIRNDYMLSEPAETETSLFKTLYPEYYSSIISVNFVDHLNVPNNAIGVKDPSVSGENKIKSWLIADGSNYILYIGSEGTICANYNSAYLFKDLTIATGINLNNFNTSFVKNMSNMFFNCQSLTKLDVSNFVTSNVTNMIQMFMQCLNLLSLNVSDWDTSNVQKMNYMFDDCKNISILDLNNWNTNNLQVVKGMFWGCERLVTLNLNKWNTSNIYDMQYMFNSTSLITLDLSNWNTDNVKYMSYMFKQSTSLTTLDLSNWSFNSLETMHAILSNCTSLKNITLPNSTVVNAIIENLPVRTSESVGTIVIKGDTTNLDTATLESKYWYAVDKDGNSLHS